LSDDRERILIVDDEPTNLRLLRSVLRDRYRLAFARGGEEALRVAESSPSLILLDAMMPGMDGYAVCRALRGNPATAAIPVIFITALQESDDEARAFEAGAVDFISKPISAPVVRARVHTHLSLVQADELKRTRLQVIQRLGRAAEYKDNETGLHVLRMSHYAWRIALARGYSESAAEELLHAAPMHDIGKIGIPDEILLKPGRLNEQELAVMRRHPLIGAEIIGETDSSLLDLARSVALYHHERWDGSGYPHGLAGEEIPQEARIVALADVFDALTSRRPYKEAWPVDDALALIRREAGSHFDPGLVSIFEQELPEILEIRSRWSED